MGSLSLLPIAHYARLQCALRLDRLAYERDSVGRKPDPDEVHDLRVSIRRLLAALKMFRDFLPPKGRRTVSQRLQAVIKAASPVRDRDIADELLAGAGLEENGRLRQRLGRERAAAVRELQRELSRPAIQDCSRGWRKSLRLVSAKPIGSASHWENGSAAGNARLVLPEVADSFFERGTLAAREEVEPAELHALRLYGKRVRYSFELFRDCYPDQLKPLIGGVKKLQDALGLIQDCEATRRLVEAGGAEEEQERQVALAFLKDRTAELRRRFLSDWHEELAAGDLAAGWRTALSEPAEAA